MRTFRLVVALALTVAGCAGSPPSDRPSPDSPDAQVDAAVGMPGGVDPALAARLQAALDTARVGQQALGAGAAIVVPGQGTWIGVSGDARPGGPALTVTDRHPIGSVTKVLTAVVILQLVQERLLTLDDPLSRWYPQFPRAAEVRVRHLLDHTSGIRDYLDDQAADVTRMIAHERMLDYPAQRGLAFTPGSSWSYSNTNYTLLGLIAERLTGKTYATLVRERIITPLGLTQTYTDGDETMPGGFLTGYALENGTYRGYPLEHPSWAWAAGAVVSTMPDQLRFFRGLLAGELLGAEMLARMKQGVQIPGAPAGVVYGLGLESSTTTWGPFHTHGGLIHLVKTASAGFPDEQIEVAVYANTVGADEYAILFAIVEALAP